MNLGIFALTAVAFAQRDEAVRGCRAHAALSTNAYYDDIYVTVGRVVNNRTGNFALTWEAWVSDERALTGACESDIRGTIVRFDRLAEKTGRKPSASAQGGFSATQQGGFGTTQRGGVSNQGGFGTTTGGFGTTAGAGGANYGSATLETSGRGSFNGFGLNMMLDRSRVVMQSGRATVMLTGGRNRLTLQGAVTRQISDREFEITIDSADRGRNANGTILLRMTPAHNAAEEIIINGTGNGQPMSGNFNQ